MRAISSDFGAPQSKTLQVLGGLFVGVLPHGAALLCHVIYERSVIARALIKKIPQRGGKNQMQRKPKFIITAAAGLILAFSTLAQATSDDAAKAPDPTPSKNADNTGRNVADRDDNTLTPMDQGNSKADLATTAQIRKEIVATKNLSVNAQNIKIITNGGKVTLRGPVNSADEKRVIAEIATKIARPGNVDNQLEVKVDADKTISANPKGE
jgi:hypothetical protein